MNNRFTKYATRIAVSLGFFFAISLLSSAASAQETIKCESNDGHRRYCGAVEQDSVSLQEQISGSACIAGRTWGVDGQGLWVDRGCRAVFFVHRGGPWFHPGQGDPWPPAGNWNGGHWDRGGACFYTDAGFRGDYFCMRRGEARPALGGYGDRISSIRVFGGARVTVFNDRNFSSDRDTTRRDVDDLRSWPVSTNRSHTWNNRISSVRIM